MKSLYITRDLDDLFILQQYCSFGQIDLHAQSQITFEEVPFSIEKPFEVVFFSSVRAGRFFLRNYDGPLSTLAYACIGEETAKRFNIDFAFIGKEAGNPEKVAEKFKNWLGENDFSSPTRRFHRKPLRPSSQVRSAKASASTTPCSNRALFPNVMCMFLPVRVTLMLFYRSTNSLSTLRLLRGEIPPKKPC